VLATSTGPKEPYNDRLVDVQACLPEVYVLAAEGLNAVTATTKAMSRD
jgi:hypothetical protein